MIATYFSRGLHPRAERKKQAEVAHAKNFTLRQALDEFLANRPKTRPTTKEGYKTTIHRYCRDWLDKPLTGINTDMVLARHTEIHEQVAKRARSSESAGYTAANKTMRSVRAVWNYALAAERIPATTVNPVAKFSRLRKWYPDRPRTEYIAPSGIKAFYEAADALENRVAATYLKLLLFTGLRNREARSLRWEYIDLEGAMIRLPHTETKAHRHLDLPMSDFVHELLSRWRATAVSEYVFPGEMRQSYMARPTHAIIKVRKASGYAALSPHVLRHTFRTNAKLVGIPESTVAELLNHSRGNSITARYDHTGSDLLRLPMQKIANHYKTLIGLPVDPATVDTPAVPITVDNVVALAVKLGKDPAEVRAFFASV
jgi:integrase